jgi:hypothetical protein
MGRLETEAIMKTKRPTMTNKTVLISQITVRDRFRKEIGDLTGLKGNIERVGWTDPILVGPEPDLRLFCGERRLQAVKELGWKEVEVRIAANLTEALRLEAEYGENVYRKDYTDEEKLALYHEILRVEREKAKERQRHHGGTAPGRPGNTSGISPGVKGDARDLAAKAAGLSASKARKLEAVAKSVAPARTGVSVKKGRTKKQVVRDLTKALRRLLPDLRWLSDPPATLDPEVLKPLQKVLAELQAVPLRPKKAA